MTRLYSAMFLGPVAVLAVAVSAARLEGQEVDAAAPAITQQQLEADWVRQDALRGVPGLPSGRSVAPEGDAAGGCDGVKNGQFGFQTDSEASGPWWQIDLGKPTSLDRILVYNRCDGCADRTSRIMVLLSDDAKEFQQVYQHNGTVFYGFSDKKPLSVDLGGAKARFVRLQQPGNYFGLDEVEIYPPGSDENIALGRPATQSSTSLWSVPHPTPAEAAQAHARAGLKLTESLRRLGADMEPQASALRQLATRLEQLPRDAPREVQRQLSFQVRWIVRKAARANPLLDFDTILFVKRAPGTLPHMSDEYYGWWSRPGGGICLLEGFKGESPQVRCLTSDWPAGSFLRPDLSYDGRKILFAYCRYYPSVAAMEKVDKSRLPEDAFYHVFEMNLDGSGRRQLTHGRYDDFDARYLPSGEIVFLSTRKGQFLQCSKAGVDSTVQATLHDSYVRCGGDNLRPVSIFTLHVMDSNGNNLRPISAFESFEWTPSVAHDGRILYTRWDYVDRFNNLFMSLWSTNPDGTNPQLVYGNYTSRPQCVFEARSIPNSHKLIFTAAAHHSMNGGSLVLLDCRRGAEEQQPLTRLTPEVPFPETEGGTEMYFANPYPLSEEYYLVSWADRWLPPHEGSSRVADQRNPVNALGLYLYDAFGNLVLLHRDPEISSMYPIPVRPRKKPPARPDSVDWDGPQEGTLLLQDVYQGLAGVERGSVKRLRVVGVPPKTQPQMNSPVLGVSQEDPGKYVLGTVPVEKDGSAYFRLPSGVPVFFQALDGDGLAVQTMRTLTYVQPSQTLSCIGCHEPRNLAPSAASPPLAAGRAPSKFLPGPPGSWPLRFDHLVQPVLDQHCVRCHSPAGEPKAARFDLTPAHAYESLMAYGQKDLHQLAFEKNKSLVGDCPARKSKLLALLTPAGGHEGVCLDPEGFSRLVTWMDVYAQRLGHFSDRQEEELRELRRRLEHLLATGAAGR